MVRAGNRGRKSKCKSSDDSDDDDYMVEEEEEVSNGGDCSFSEGDDYLRDLEAEVEGGDYKKAITSKPKRGFLNRCENESKRSRNRKRVSYSEEKDNVDLDGDGDDDDGDEEFRPDTLDGLDEEEGWTTKRRRVASKVEKDEEEEEYDFNDDDEEVEWDDEKKTVTSKPKRGSLKRRGNDDKISRNRKMVSYSEEKDDVDLDEDDEEFRPDGLDGLNGEEGRTAKRRRVACNKEKDDEEEEYDFNDNEEEEEEEEEDYDFDDEEFTDEVDSIDEDKDVQVKKKVKRPAERRGLRKVNVQRRKRSRRGIKKTSRKNANSRSQVRNCDSDGFFTKKTPIMIQESKKKTHVRRKKRSVVQSDSDFFSSGASDCNFTISEEEREQVRDASKICKTTTVSLRSSSSSKKAEVNLAPKQPPKPPVRKGKEKVESAKIDVPKRVCGICLSEEGKRTVRGTLNCCSHYFCFSCIIEWSKVESRCPLCKQRFVTIRKPARSNTGTDLRDVITDIPQRDQIYQPSEEEIRGYLDPYENVMCTECQLGGDDNLMLLCDICDSPAHTYCVGLGREVPEGNWYCEGCRPVALASLMSQHPLPDQTPININVSHRSSTSANMEYGLESATLPSPYSQVGTAGLTSPRYPFMDGLSSPRSGAGASTVSGRRHIQRQVHTMRARNGNGRFDNNFSVPLGSDYPEFQVDQDIASYQLPRTPVAGTSHYNVLSHPSTVPDGGIFPARSNNTRHVTLEPGFSASDLYEIGQLQHGINMVPDHARHYHYSNGSVMNSDWNSSFSAKALVQSMVESYLESISRNMVLDQDISVVAKRSTHTILAACGFEHETGEVCLIQQELFPKCRHAERQTSPLRGCCSSCFESFVRQAAKAIWNEHCPGFLWVRD